MNETVWSPTSDNDWDKVRPLLDQALAELNDFECDAVALRFLECRTLADVGEQLGLTEEAASKRVERAVDKLARGLARRGVTSTTMDLGHALTMHANVAAPTGLAVMVTAVSLAAGRRTWSGERHR